MQPDDARARVRARLDLDSGGQLRHCSTLRGAEMWRASRDVRTAMAVECNASPALRRLLLGVGDRGRRGGQVVVSRMVSGNFTACSLASRWPLVSLRHHKVHEGGPVRASPARLRIRSERNLRGVMATLPAGVALRTCVRGDLEFLFRVYAASG